MLDVKIVLDAVPGFTSGGRRAGVAAAQQCAAAIRAGAKETGNG